jgi:predicted nuclease with TOPRIM domain
VIDTLQIYRDLAETLDDAAARKLAATLGAIYNDLQQAVTRQDFEELKSAVNQLAQAQTRTEGRVNELTLAVNELAQAQARTEERLNQLAQAQARTEERLNELAQAQARTEERLNQLAQAQTRTEERLNQLAQAQARTEERLNQLAQAQTRTEERLNELAQAQKKTEEILQKHEIRLGTLDGRTFENEVCRKAASYFGSILRRCRVVEMIEIEQKLPPSLPDADYDDLLQLDLLVEGIPSGPGSSGRLLAATEISLKLDDYDIERAGRRAGILRKAGLPAAAVALGREIHPATLERAGNLGVCVLLERQPHHWGPARNFTLPAG